MNKGNTLLILALIGWCCTVHAQQLDSLLTSVCNTAKDDARLSANEKQVILYMNYVRTHPQEFLKNYLPAAADQLHERSCREYKSLERELSRMKPVGLLLPDEAFRKFAEVHAMDMGKTGRTGHSSSKGKSFVDRVGKDRKAIAENCDYGYDNALLIVCHLLIDKDVSDLGHRKNTLNPVYHRVGVSIQPHKKFVMNCVEDFSD